MELLYILRWVNNMSPSILLIIGLYIIIISMAFTTLTRAFANNESSYEYGFKLGRSGYQCSNFQADCDNGLSSCDVTIYSLKSTPQLTNKTSCLEGLVRGWKQWCNTDLHVNKNTVAVASTATVVNAAVFSFDIIAI